MFRFEQQKVVLTAGRTGLPYRSIGCSFFRMKWVYHISRHRFSFLGGEPTNHQITLQTLEEYFGMILHGWHRADVAGIHEFSQKKGRDCVNETSMGNIRNKHWHRSKIMTSFLSQKRYHESEDIWGIHSYLMTHNG